MLMMITMLLVSRVILVTRVTAVRIKGHLIRVHLVPDLEIVQILFSFNFICHTRCHLSIGKLCFLWCDNKVSPLRALISSSSKSTVFTSGVQPDTSILKVLCKIKLIWKFLGAFCLGACSQNPHITRLYSTSGKCSVSMNHNQNGHIYRDEIQIEKYPTFPLNLRPRTQTTKK